MAGKPKIDELAAVADKHGWEYTPPQSSAEDYMFKKRGAEIYFKFNRRGGGSSLITIDGVRCHPSALFDDVRPGDKPSPGLMSRGAFAEAVLSRYDRKKLLDDAIASLRRTVASDERALEASNRVLAKAREAMAKVFKCDACMLTEDHVHCPECGSTKHAAEYCDMED